MHHIKFYPCIGIVYKYINFIYEMQKTTSVGEPGAIRFVSTFILICVLDDFPKSFKERCAYITTMEAVQNICSKVLQVNHTMKTLCPL